MFNDTELCAAYGLMQRTFWGGLSVAESQERYRMRVDLEGRFIAGERTVELVADIRRFTDSIKEQADA